MRDCLLCSGWHRARRSWSIRIICVAWWTSKPVLLVTVHRKTGGGRGATGRSMDRTVCGGRQ